MTHSGLAASPFEDGDELLDGVPTKHFSEGGPVGPVGQVDDPGGKRVVSDRLDFWVDDDTGQMVQVVTETVYREQRREDGPTHDRMVKWPITFSGVGEPYSFTAPTLPAQ